MDMDHHKKVVGEFVFIRINLGSSAYVQTNDICKNPRRVNGRELVLIYKIMAMACIRITVFEN